MESWVEKYLNHLDTLSGSNAEYYRASPPDEFPPVSVVTYWGDEETRLITSFTAGLSSVFHPSWKFARPELCISVEWQELRGGWAMCDIAYKIRGGCTFCYVEILYSGVDRSK